MPTPGPLNANYQSLIEPFIDICREYHVIGDGVTDCSAAINMAIAAATANFGAGTIYFPPGTYLCKSTIALLGQVHLRGAGIEASIIKLANSVNADLVSSGSANINLGAAFGSGSTGGIYNWSIQDLTLDGNKAGQASGTSYCLRVYAYGYILNRVRIRNGYTGGALFDWNGGNTSPGQDQSQAQFNDLIVHDNNGIGLQIGGPHDSQFANLVTFSNGSHGLHVAPNATGCLFTNLRSSQVPTGVSAVAILVEAARSIFISCVAQDSDTVQLVLLANEIIWFGLVNGGSGSNSTAGVQIGQTVGGTPYTGSLNQSSGSSAAVSPFSCYVEGILLSNNGTNGQLWLASDGGNNNFRVVAQQSSGKVLTGTVASTSQLQAAMNGLAADGSTAKGGWFRIAQNANLAFTVSDRADDIFNINSNSKRVELVNAAILRMYSDSGYSTRTIEIGTNGTVALQQSTSAAAIANSGTITTSVGVARLNPATDVTGIIMQAGTLSGQQCWVVNESSHTVTLHTTPSTSHVADSATEAAIEALSARLYIWNGSAWFPAK